MYLNNNEFMNNNKFINNNEIEELLKCINK
jgi:hypothetical protein